MTLGVRTDNVPEFTCSDLPLAATCSCDRRFSVPVHAGPQGDLR